MDSSFHFSRAQEICVHCCLPFQKGEVPTPADGGKLHDYCVIPDAARRKKHRAEENDRSVIAFKL